VMTSPTVSQIGSEHRAHSNKRCMVFSTSPHSPKNVVFIRNSHVARKIQKSVLKLQHHIACWNFMTSAS
jgi:hypothetical protein